MSIIDKDDIGIRDLYLFPSWKCHITEIPKLSYDGHINMLLDVFDNSAINKQVSNSDTINTRDSCVFIWHD